MILEFLAWATTPANARYRRMGFLREQVSIGARRARCRAAWAPHLERSKTALRRAALSVPPDRRRKALIFGSGLLLDLPLDDLTALYDEVLLVDLVQPWRARLAAWRRPKVRLIEHDVTEAMAALDQAVETGRDLPDIAPRRFLDDPAIGFVASVNLASQLPYVPLRYLERRQVGDEATREAFARRLIERHFDYLRAFAPRATVALIADIERLTFDRTGREVGRVSALHDASPPESGEEWDWNICPIPEFAPDRAIVNRVRAASVRF